MFLELNFFHSYAKLYTIQCVIHNLVSYWIWYDWLVTARKLALKSCENIAVIAAIIECVSYTQSCLILNMVWLTSDSMTTGTWKLWLLPLLWCHEHIWQVWQPYKTLTSWVNLFCSSWAKSEPTWLLLQAKELKSKANKVCHLEQQNIPHPPSALILYCHSDGCLDTILSLLFRWVPIYYTVSVTLIQMGA